MEHLLCNEQSLIEEKECFKRITMVLRLLKQKGFIQEMELEADFKKSRVEQVYWREKTRFILA